MRRFNSSAKSARPRAYPSAFTNEGKVKPSECASGGHLRRFSKPMREGWIYDEPLPPEYADHGQAADRTPHKVRRMRRASRFPAPLRGGARLRPQCGVRLISVKRSLSSPARSCVSADCLDESGLAKSRCLWISQGHRCRAAEHRLCGPARLKSGRRRRCSRVLRCRVKPRPTAETHVEGRTGPSPFRRPDESVAAAGGLTPTGGRHALLLGCRSLDSEHRQLRRSGLDGQITCR
jgi:hypothetical protein